MTNHARWLISSFFALLMAATPCTAQEGSRSEARERRPRSSAGNLKRIFEQFDANQDGVLDRAELPERMRGRFAQMDGDGDGKVTLQEMQQMRRGSARRGRRSGEVNTRSAKGERIPDKLKVGDLAPDFTLPLVSGNDEVTLSSFQGKRPVVLIFASYT